MTWIPPARYSAGDTGGTANQVGGAEGYWEGAGAARVGRGWQQGATDAACVRSWRAAQPGTIRVVGRVMKEYYRRSDGQSLRIRILHNDTSVWPAQDGAVVPVGDLTGITHDFTLSIQSGDTIRFVLDKTTEPESAVLAWMPRIVYTDADVGGQSTATVVRILCGADQPYTDRCGNVWSADAYYAGGQAVSTTADIAGPLPTAADQPLYRAGRAGSEFVYAIPVPTGLYTLRLKFAEPQCDWFFQRPFHLEINGRRTLCNFDICHAARGPRRAYECVFRYLVPNDDGNLVLRFASGWDPQQTSQEAIVQAIEVLPEHKSLVRIDVGSTAPFVDWNGFSWAADDGVPSDQVLTSTTAVAQASPTLHDQPLYHTARTGKTIRYRVPVAEGLYTVHLKFAELWLTEPGKRPLDITINGRCVWDDWDPATAAGQLAMAADIRAEDITPDASGHILIQVDAAGEHDAILQGIEIE
jgi:hypothetical protein